MVREAVSWSAVVLILLSSAAMVLGRDWRWWLALLAGQYLAVFWLTTLFWPVGLSSAKLVTGWMAIATLGITRLGLSGSGDDNHASWQLLERFHLVLVVIISILAVVAAPGLEPMLPGIGAPAAAGCALLISLGLLHLGLTSNVLRVVVALLSFLAGFELLYSAVEGSILVTGLMSVVNLGLGLVGS
jgi:hypothetical protein